MLPTEGGYVPNIVIQLLEKLDHLGAEGTKALWAGFRPIADITCDVFDWLFCARSCQSKHLSLIAGIGGKLP
jgi:hypothetical protein